MEVGINNLQESDLNRNLMIAYRQVVNSVIEYPPIIHIVTLRISIDLPFSALCPYSSVTKACHWQSGSYQVFT